ncbi:MAG: SIMPL domain-containing protein [Candidatus Nanopelagicales bacterium]|jgi:hypothetical protein|nr:SIMPL domain-containing protein [Candidatus Nanopelagicales bacterium]
MKTRNTLITVMASSILVSLAIFAGLWFISGGLSEKGKKGITVTGSAQVETTADTAVWNIYINTQLPTISAAVTKVDADTKVLTEYLISQGILGSEITTYGVSTSTAFEVANGTQTSNIIGYVANNTLRIRTKEVQKIKTATQNIGQVLQTGISASSGSPEYFISNLAILRPKVIEEAVADAKARATAMVAAIGGTVGEPISGSSGSVQVNPPDSVESEYGSYDTSTIEKSVRAVVSVTFKVN